MIIDELEREKIELNSRLSLRMQDTLDHSRETGNFPRRRMFLRGFLFLRKKTFLKQRVRYGEVGVWARVTISTRSQSRSFPHISR